MTNTLNSNPSGYGSFSAKASLRPTLKRPMTGHVLDKRTGSIKVGKQAPIRASQNTINLSMNRKSMSKKRTSISPKRRSKSKTKTDNDLSKVEIQRPRNDSKEKNDFKNEKLVAAERQILTPMTPDGVYYILEPTLSQDHGPNYKEKIYNDIRLNYKQDKSKKKVFNFAEAKCLINIPLFVKPEKRKRKRTKAQLDTSIMQSTARHSSKRNSPGRKSSPKRNQSPRKSEA